ncbi:PREDICTED: LOW QUALITY PROTEIN [Prunus dulcis]|uniref:PREDICTED: LOW QUALITY PROTEIN n=1 Tax=Prunus dulcis TaxID=3755 RepID=A0A5E4FNM4_PRUDU|nr:PREDICTED: LOW QUALITY PROTEIN [Prunus dulcis]
MRFWHWNRQGMFFRRQRSEVTTYLEELKKAGGRGGNLSGHGSIIKPDAMLPNEITRYVVEDGDVGESTELQWKATVEDMYLKQQQQQMQGQGLGKFKNCLAVCHIKDFMGIRPRELAVSLGLLVSELSEVTAWKGKLLLHSIEGDDLKSKCEFMMRTCSSELGLYVHSRKTLYEAKQSEFKEQGYGDNAVPHILLWNMGDWNKPCIEEHHRGVTLLRGFSENLLKSFLDNGGEIGRRRLMEAAIADKEYQALSVVD